MSDPIGSENVHGPSHASDPVTLIAGTSKRRSISTFVGSAVVGDERPEDGEAALVDELAVRVDDRLGRSLRQAFDLAVDDLDGTIDHALAVAALEDQLERLGEVEPPILAGTPSGRTKSIR